MVLLPKKNFILRKEFFGGLLYIKSKNIICELNKEGYKIISLLEKGYTKEDISKLLNLNKNILNNFLKNVENKL